MRVVKVTMISSFACPRCAVVEGRIRNAALSAKVGVDIEKVDSSQRKAVELGIEHGLDDVPSFVIHGGKAFSGDSFGDAELEDALRRAAKSR